MKQCSPAYLLLSIWPLASGLQACRTSVATVDLAAAPVPVKLRMTPATVPRAGVMQFRVTTPNADSIQIRSADGLDRYTGRGRELEVYLPSNFGDSTALARYAVRASGHLLNVLKKPVIVKVCRESNCREYYHELLVRLPEHNRRQIALSGGWSTAFTRQALKNPGRHLLQDGGEHSVWNFRGELATKSTSVRLQGFLGSQERLGLLDLAHVMRPSDQGPGYGLAVHLAASSGDWLPIMRRDLPTRATYQASIGPAIMLKGLSFSTQFGLYINGGQTLQEMSTVLSFNGGFTEVRYPFSIMLERRIALGNEPVVARRRDALQRLTVGLDLVPGVALLLRMTNRRGAWPAVLPGGQVLFDEVSYTVGAEYTLGW
jgi:hypothetical protein